MKNIEFILNDHFTEFVEDWDHKIYLLVGGYGSSKSYHVDQEATTGEKEGTGSAGSIRYNSG